MKKTQFVELVQQCGGYKTKAEAENVIKAFTGAITEALVKKEDVTLIGFASFSTGLQKGKSGTVPGTSKTYTTADKMVPRIKFGSTIKDRVEAGK